MPRMRIRDFSGGLVTNQSEFDLAENQYVNFAKVKNKKPGRLERPNAEQTVSGTGDGTDIQTELVLYRTEKDAANADVSTEWWLYANGILVYRQDVSETIAGVVLTVIDTTPTPTGAWQASQTHSGVSSSITTGSGTGITCNITTDGSGNPTFVIASGGLGYAANNTITFTDPGSTDNKAIITVATVTGFIAIAEGWSTSATPDLLAHNQILRLSDGGFTNNTKWYGHIKRNVLGQGLSLTSFVPYYLSPHRKTAVNDWFVQDAAITAPTIVKMGMAHDGGNDLSANSQVGIFVYEPRHQYGSANLENDEHNAWVNALDNETFDPSDRWTVTYLYDHVQESELARDGDGNIGVSGFEVATGSDDEADSNADIDGAISETAASIDLDTGDGALFQTYTYIKIDKEIIFIKSIATDTLHVRRGQLKTEPKEHPDNTSVYYQSSPQKGRAINVVLNGLTASGYHNPRITGLNIYWQPKGDVDWYLVESLDINRGYADSVLATTPDTLVPGSSDTAPYFSSKSFNSAAMKNFGYWMPFPTHTALDDVSVVSNFSATAWERASTNFSNSGSGNIGILSKVETGDSGLGTQFNRIGAYHTLVTGTGSSDEKVTFASGNNINRVFAKQVASYANVANADRVTTHNENTAKATLWYIPFDGLKLATYNSMTGRAAKTKLSAIKWNTSAVVSNRGYYADVDTVDENEQTAREKNRIYFTDPFQLDVILPGRYFDVGRNDGDKIIKLISYRGKLFVFKSRNTYVYNTRHQMEKVFIGVGAVHKHAVFETPIGLVCANKQAVVAVTPTSVRELSFNIRDTYQGLTFEQTAVGYDGIDNELLVMHDSDATTIYVMNMDNGSWIERDIESADNRSNFVISSGLRAQYLEID